MKKETIKIVAQKDGNNFFFDGQIKGFDMTMLNHITKSLERTYKPTEPPFLVNGRPKKNDLPGAYFYLLFGDADESLRLGVHPCFYTGYATNPARFSGHSPAPVAYTLVWPLKTPKTKREAHYAQNQIEESLRQAVIGGGREKEKPGEKASWSNGILTSKEREAGWRGVTLAELVKEACEMAEY